MKKIWFKAKTYGWGWTPATWEGWFVTTGYALIVVGGVYYFQDEAELLYLVPFALILTAIFIIICYKKGEKPRWRWGKDN